MPLIYADKFMPSQECACAYFLRKEAALNFNWGDVEKNSPDILSRFLLIEQIKDRALILRCSLCGRYWVLSLADLYTFHADQPLLEKLRQWGARKMEPKGRVLKDLVALEMIHNQISRISASDRKRADSNDSVIRHKIKRRFPSLDPTKLGLPHHGWHPIPCSIHTVTGTVVDPALIVFDLPNELQTGRAMLFFDDVSSVGPSEFSLRKEVLKASEEADEVRMGFYPVRVTVPSGQSFILPQPMVFAQAGEIPGSQIQLGGDIGADWQTLSFVKCPDYTVILGDPPDALHTDK